MKEQSLEDFRTELKAQGVDKLHLAFVCPMCATVQSATDLIAAGAGTDFDSVERVLGFSCVGRYTGAGSPRKEPDGKPCNWTLGGFFTMHKLEVIDEEGKRHAYFEPATPEQAQAHAAQQPSQVKEPS